MDDDNKVEKFVSVRALGWNYIGFWHLLPGDGRKDNGHGGGG